MTDEKFLRGCIGFFLYPMTSVCLSCGFVGGLFGILFQDIKIGLVSLVLMFMSVGIQHVFPIPSLLMGSSTDEIG